MRIDWPILIWDGILCYCIAMVLGSLKLDAGNWQYWAIFILISMTDSNVVVETETKYGEPLE